jgi:hypothetical protein
LIWKSNKKKKKKREREKKEKEKEKVFSDPNENPENLNDEFDSRGKRYFYGLRGLPVSKRARSLGRGRGRGKLVQTTLPSSIGIQPPSSNVINNPPQLSNELNIPPPPSNIILLIFLMIQLLSNNPHGITLVPLIHLYLQL